LKTVLVAGSSRGIGRAIALELTRAGYDVCLHGSKESEALNESIELTCKLHNTTPKKLVFDVTNRAETKSNLEAHIKEHGAFYGVVLAFGIAKDGPFPGLSDDDWDHVLRVDLDGFYNVLKPLVMPMIQRRDGGRIVTISSISGIVGNRGQVNYSAAKAGLIGATKALAKELAKRKITVNCVAPAGIETDMIDDRLKEEMCKINPMGRLGKVEEVAGAVKYLFSEEASYMSSQVLVLNGGMF
jgi:3-oxoacyl-[acyl-carrier protein] reductase